MTRLILITHGATEATRAASFPADEPLTDAVEADIRTAVSAATHASADSPSAPTARRHDVSSPHQGLFVRRQGLLARRHDVAVCSPARRCVQTAAALGLDSTVDIQLRDCDFGQWQGRLLDEVTAADPDGVESWLTDPAAAPHGGESIHDLLVRAGRWLHAHPSGPGTTIAVTHPAVVRAIVVAALMAGPAAFWRIDVAPLTQTTLSGGDTRWNVAILGLPLI